MTGGELVLYLPDGRIEPPPDPYGRQVANAGTFRALVRFGGYDRVHVQCKVPPPPAQLRADLRVPPDAPDRPSAPGWPHISTGPLIATAPAAATTAGTLLSGQAYLSEPAWIRRYAGRDGDYSIVGTMFAFASATHRERMVSSTLAPVHPWDAIVCSSPTLAQTVAGVLDAWEDHLRDRLGDGAELPRPQLPVIGFGSEVDTLARRGDDVAARESLRAELGIGAEDVMVFSLGRLSFYDKAFPQPMFRAVAQAQRDTESRVHLVMAGWFPNGAADRARYEQAHRRHAPDVPLHLLDGNDQQLVARCWAGADIFLLLSDTILETFGQALVEAMAAGLPLVVSDWDGYRFIVHDGVEGFLIPTLGAAPGRLGETLALLQYAGELGYARYAGAVAAHTAVSVPAAAAALTQLVESPQLRAAMGAAGRRAARQRFDWPVIVAAYQQLFAELAERRRGRSAEPPAAERRRLNPLRGDPFADFAALPSTVIDDHHHLRLTGLEPPDPQIELDAMFGGVRGRDGEVAAVLQLLATHPDATVGEVLDGFEPRRRPFVRNTLMWLAKSGAVDWT